MAEFPFLPNLDDGELWLPSERFQPNNNNNNNNRPLSFMDDDLAHQFSRITLLQRNLQPNTSFPPPIFERLRPPVHSDPFARSSRGYFAANNGGLDAGHNLVTYDAGALSSVGPTPRPFYKNHLLEPAQTREVDKSILKMRAKILQSQQNRSQNRVLPVQGTGVRAGSFVTKSGGTGVFLPRIAATATATTTTTTTTTTATATTFNDVRKKQGVRNRREAQMIQPRNSMSRIAMGNHEDCHFQLSPEMALPQDWTY